MSDGWERTERGWRKSYSAPVSPVARGDFPCPRVQTDTMPLTEHVDGKSYDSKSAYRAVTKAKGYIEVGNDPARLRTPERPKENTTRSDNAIRRAIAQLG